MDTELKNNGGIDLMVSANLATDIDLIITQIVNSVPQEHVELAKKHLGDIIALARQDRVTTLVGILAYVIALKHLLLPEGVEVMAVDREGLH